MKSDYDLLCFSHLRWAFVWQRPQHLLSRALAERRVFYVEEPMYDSTEPALAVYDDPRWPVVVTPHLPSGLTRQHEEAELVRLLDGLYEERALERFVLWHYSSWAVPITRQLEPLVTVYDCMDELSLFADSLAARNEDELLARADVVFTGGRSLYEAKRSLHPNVQLFPSSVDVEHFAQARRPLADPPDQSRLRRPRLGYFGVLDERIDLDLIARVAELRPDWELVLVGPVAKIDPASVPTAANIHQLGAKRYEELPSYLANWDVALMPFAHNDATRFISPTKGPEYLAAGKPVVSTSIRDVVTPYGDEGLVAIADTPHETVAAVEAALAQNAAERLRRVDAFLAETSWDRTWAEMKRAVDEVLRERRASQAAV